MWVQHTLASAVPWHPFAAPLQSLSCVTAALLLAVLLQVGGLGMRGGQACRRPSCCFSPQASRSFLYPLGSHVL